MMDLAQTRAALEQLHNDPAPLPPYDQAKHWAGRILPNFMPPTSITPEIWATNSNIRNYYMNAQPITDEAELRSIADTIKQLKAIVRDHKDTDAGTKASNAIEAFGSTIEILKASHRIGEFPVDISEVLNLGVVPDQGLI